MSLIIYLAGPMTGLPQLNYPAFMAWEESMRNVGYEVLNPARVDEQFPKRDGESREWGWYMRKTIAMLMEADGIALLPGWRRSRGARLERDLALRLEMPCALVEVWVSRHRVLQKEHGS